VSAESGQKKRFDMAIMEQVTVTIKDGKVIYGEERTIRDEEPDYAVSQDWKDFKFSVPQQPSKNPIIHRTPYAMTWNKEAKEASEERIARLQEKGDMRK